MKRTLSAAASGPVEKRIVTVRDQKVILDLDLAQLYGVPTKALNQAVKRNSSRFPEDFLFQLSEDEMADLNRSQFVTGSQKHRDPRFKPYAFTEHGAIMVATVLNSPRAIQMSLFVVRAFLRMRAALKESADLAQRLSLLENELKMRLSGHETAVVDRLQRILEILDPPKREMGFHIKEDSVPYRTKRRTAATGARSRGLATDLRETTWEPSLKGKKHFMKRYGMVIGVRPEKIEEYKHLHAAAWPDVLRKIKECHIQNYSIYLRRLDDGQYYLFSYFEYTGTDFQADMAAMAADETTQRWWALCKPCQQPLEGRAADEWWAGMEEVFHYD